MATVTVVNGDIVGGNNIKGGSGVDVDALIRAKMAAKIAEAQREAEQGAEGDDDRSGGVNFFGNGKITIGGKVYQKDNIKPE